MGVHVTAHAIARFKERVADLPEPEIVAALSSDTIAQAVDMGCCAVKLGSGHHAVIKGYSVVTVLPKGGRPIAQGDW